MRVPDQATPAGVARRLVECLAGEARAVGVADVRIGLGYTAVLLRDGRAGLAYTFRDEAGGGCCSVFKGLRPLRGRSAVDAPAGLPGRL